MERQETAACFLYWCLLAGAWRSSGVRGVLPAVSTHSDTHGTCRVARPYAGARGCAAWTTG